MKRSLAKKIVVALLIVTVPIQGRGDCNDYFRDIRREQAKLKVHQGVLLGLLGTVALGLVGVLTSVIVNAVKERRHVKELLAGVTREEVEALRATETGPGEQKVARLGGLIYFLRENYLFGLNGDVVFALGKVYPASVQPYANSVVVRSTGGTIAIRTAYDGRWWYFQEGARQVIATGETIVALTWDGKLIRLSAAPGNFRTFEEDTSYWTVSTDSNGNATMSYVPSTDYHLHDANNRRVGFVRTGITGVSRIEAVDGDVKIYFNDGTSRMLSQGLAGQ
jgi:hypothetical protein